MKFKVHLKDPDGVGDSLDRAVELSRPEGLDDEEWESVKEVRQEKFYDVMKKWFEYGEYLTVEIDTEAETCVVVPNG